MDTNSQRARDTFAKNLRDTMRKNGISQIDIAKRFNVTTSTVSDRCNAKKYPRVDKIQMLADYFGVLKSDLTEEKIGRNFDPIVHKIPILGYISAGLPLYAEEHVEGYTYTEHNGVAEYFALTVTGDSMTAAKINDGDILIVRRQEMVENGEIAVVMVNDNNATVKRFKQDGNIVTLLPQSYNPEHQVQIYDLKKNHIRIIGKVVECKTMFE